MVSFGSRQCFSRQLAEELAIARGKAAEVIDAPGEGDLRDGDAFIAARKQLAPDFVQPGDMNEFARSQPERVMERIFQLAATRADDAG